MDITLLLRTQGIQSDLVAPKKYSNYYTGHCTGVTLVLWCDFCWLDVQPKFPTEVSLSTMIRMSSCNSCDLTVISSRLVFLKNNAQGKLLFPGVDADHGLAGRHERASRKKSHDCLPFPRQRERSQFRRLFNHSEFIFYPSEGKLR